MNEHVDLSVAKCATDTDASVAEGSRKRPLIGPFTEDDVNKRSFYALTRKRFFGCNSAINAKGRSCVLKATGGLERWVGSDQIKDSYVEK